MLYGDNLKQLKENLTKKELDFLNNYEPSIRELLKKLANIGVIKMAFTAQQAKRLMNFRITLNSPAFLHRNVIRFTELNDEERGNVISYLKKMNFEMEEIGNQMFSVITHSYHNHIEDLKIHFELLIDFELLCKTISEKEPRFKSFMWMVRILKKVSNNNDFLNFLDNKVRNSIAHFTFFYYKGLIYFCDGLFDDDPIKMEISELMIESKQMNILALGFFHIYGDMFKKLI